MESFEARFAEATAKLAEARARADRAKESADRAEKIADLAQEKTSITSMLVRRELEERNKRLAEYKRQREIERAEDAKRSKESIESHEDYETIIRCFNKSLITFLKDCLSWTECTYPTPSDLKERRRAATASKSIEK